MVFPALAFALLHSDDDVCSVVISLQSELKTVSLPLVKEDRR